MDKLRECPFCGGEAFATVGVESGAPKSYWIAGCASCTAVTCAPTMERAVFEWNRRPEPENKPLTNADRIRSMTDGELAQILVSEPIAETIPFCQNKPDGGGK